MVEVDPANGRDRLAAFNSLLVADFFEAFVDVREMVGGHVLYEGAHEFFIANAAIEPAQKEK